MVIAARRVPGGLEIGAACRVAGGCIALAGLITVLRCRFALPPLPPLSLYRITLYLFGCLCSSLPAGMAAVAVRGVALALPNPGYSSLPGSSRIAHRGTWGLVMGRFTVQPGSSQKEAPAEARAEESKFRSVLGCRNVLLAHARGCCLLVEVAAVSWLVVVKLGVSTFLAVMEGRIIVVVGWLLHL